MSYISAQQQLLDIQNNTEATNAAKAKDRMGQSEIDGDAFLQLLMTQLKYQDPMNPMDTSEFTAQQAQFTQVSALQDIKEGIETMNSTNAASSSIMQASSLIGKEVKYANPEYDADVEGSQEYLSGVVESANFYSDGTTLQVNGEEILLAQVSSVSNPSE